MKAYFEIWRDRNYSLHLSTAENNEIDPHYHSNIEMVFVLDGEIDITIGGQTRRLHEGDIAISDSYDVHSYSTPDRSFIKILIIPIELIGSFSRLSEGKTFCSPFICDNPEMTLKIGGALSGLEQVADAKSPLTVKGYLYVILGLIARNNPLVVCEKDSGALGPVRSMLVYLDYNYREQIKMSDLAKKFGYNKDYLSRMFNSTLGCGYKNYMNILRARNAANRILNSNSSISDIAYDSGFSSQRTFNRAFKDVYGITPIEYKRSTSM